MKRKLIAFGIPVLLLLAVIGCTDAWEPVTILQAEVMAVHDSSMVKMDDIYQTQKGLKQLLELKGGDTLIITKSDIEKMNRGIAELDQADAAMFDWMAQYKAPKPEDYTPETALEYLNAQLASITSVDQEMDAAIKNGESILKEYENE